MTPSKIDWCDETVNPLGWGCYGPGGTPEEPKPCWYCYAHRMAIGHPFRDCELCRQFIPHWHPEQLEKPGRWKKTKKIFWQSMGDIFHPYTTDWQIKEVLAVVAATPQHIHIFCTKNPARYAEFNPWPGNCILLTTITGLAAEENRVPEILRADARIRGLSIEPLLGPIECPKWWLQIHTEGQWLNVVECGQKPEKQHLNWLIIGALTGYGAEKHWPRPIWVINLINQARAAGVPIFVKGALSKQFPIQEWAEV